MANTTNQALKGKLVLVTGGSRGIGAATVVELASCGANVAFTYISPSSAELSSDIVAQVAAFQNGALATAIQADLRDPDSPARIIRETLSAFNTTTIDILVNNAVADQSVPIDQYTHDLFTHLFDTNLRGPVFLTQALVPHLPVAGGGRIINIGSLASRMPIPHAAIMSAAKAALEEFTRVWAAELGAKGHAVNYLSVGAVDMDSAPKARENSAVMAEMQEKVKAETSYEQRWGTPEDIAISIAMIAEPQSKWITGQGISVSGGSRMF
ncbi:NAD(P)-binding protein [Corynespora cassiicola Philippines]|uniref:NAD(P)-binding protein n=1 Tax=Corynespora cassiicola Philippines TaxID=1448308 RepID=A0A2T2N7P7_CORCC|nr:NAD(P)-binding protein [Corynespora cassiicola Philippines]